jgi:serine/threonine-protein kinase RsbW
MESLPRLIEFVSSYARSHGFEPRRTREVELVVEEALVNVFRHAYRGEDPGDVEVHAEMQDECRLAVEILDQGVPFDPQDAPEPDIEAPLSERTVGKLGIYLIRKLSDEIRYQREERTNRLTLILRGNR